MSDEGIKLVAALLKRVSLWLGVPQVKRTPLYTLVLLLSWFFPWLCLCSAKCRCFAASCVR